MVYYWVLVNSTKVKFINIKLIKLKLITDIDIFRVFHIVFEYPDSKNNRLYRKKTRK